MPVVDGHSQGIEIRRRAQLAREKPEKFLRRANRDERLQNAE